MLTGYWSVHADAYQAGQKVDFRARVPCATNEKALP